MTNGQRKKQNRIVEEREARVAENERNDKIARDNSAKKYAAANDAAAQFNSETKDVFYQKHSAEDLAAAHAAKAQMSAYVNTADAAKRARDNLILGMNSRDGLTATAYVSPEEQKRQRDNLNTYNMYMRRLRNMGYNTGSDPLSSTVRSALDTRAKYDTPDAWDQFTRTNEANALLEQYTSGLDAEGMRADVDTMSPYVDTAKRLKDFAEHTRDFAVATNGKGLDPTKVQGYDDFRQYLIGNGTITENSSPEEVLNAAAQFVDRYSRASADLGVYDRYMQTKTMRDDAVSDPEFDAISQAWDGRGIENWWETTEYADDWGESKAFYTDEERRIYAYYREKERRGEVEKGTAEAYKKSIAEAYNTREALGLYGEVQGNPVAELIFKGAAGLDQWMQGKIGEVDMLTGREARPVSAVQLASGMVQEDLGKIGNDKLLGKKGLHGETIGQNLGDVIQTVGNMVPSMMVSAIAGNILPTYGLNDKWTKHLSELAGAVTLGSSAAGNAYQEMLRNGYTRQQAATYGVLTGASETAMQYLIGGISFMGGQVAQTAGAKTLQQIASGFTKAATRAVVENGGKFLLNMLSEGTEELVQDILEPFFMAWATGQIREDVDWEDAMYSFALGALTAAGMDGTTNTLNTLRLGKNFVAERVRAGDLQGVVDALQMFDADTIAGQIGAEYANADASKLGVRDYANLFTGYKNAVSESTASGQTESEISEMLRQRGVHSWIVDDVAGEIANGGTYSSRMRSMMEADPTLIEAVVSVENALNDADTATNRRLTALSNIGRKESKQTTVGIEGYLDKLAEAEKERDAFAKEQIKRDLAGTAANLSGAKSVNEAMLRAGAQRQTSASIDADVASAVANINAGKKAAPAAYSPSAFTRDNVKADSAIAPVRFEKSMEGGVNVVMANGNRTDIRSSVFQNDAQAAVYGTLADGIEDGTISVNTANAILNAVNFDAPNPSLQAARMAMIASHTGSGVEIAPEFMKSYRGDVLTRRQASFAEKLGKDNYKATRKAAQDYALEDTEAKPAEPAKRETKRAEGDRISREDAAWEKKMRGRGVIISAPRSTLTNRQLYSVEAVGRVCADVTGGKVIFFESVVDPKTGARVFSADVEGTKYKAGDVAPNGEYMLRDGTILLDLNAGDYGTGTILYAFAHELTHFVRDWNKDRYAALEQFVLDEFKRGNVDVDELIEAQIAKAAAQGEERTRGGAMEEVIADAMQEMFTAGDVLERMERLKNKDRTLWEKIRDKISELSQKIKEVYRRLNPDSAEAKELKAIGADIDKLAQMFAESVAEAGEAYQQNGADGVMTDRSGEATYVSSVRTVLSKAQREVAKKRIMDRLMDRFPEMKETDIDAWLEAETSLAKIILEPERVDYLDYLPGSGEIAIKKNSDYPQGTVDFSNICPKRRRVSEIMSQVFKQFPNQIFQPEQLSQILNIMKARDLVTPCMICYVEDRRQRDSIVADLFVRSLEAYRKGEKSLDGKKDFNDGQIKAFNMAGTDGYTPDIGELVTPEGMRELGEKHPGILNAWKRFNNARGMAAVRLLLPEAEYKREIRSYAPRTVASKNNKGGLRFYSFSDFEIIHMLDIVQALTDCAEVGLFAQGYTKVNEYARLVKDTGMKLNRSLIPKGVLGYHVDENGKKVLDFDSVEGINCTDPNFFSDYADNPNIGNIVIGVNRDQILTAMLDPRIDQIIPFHSGQSDKVLKIKGIDQWDNYKDSQTDKVLVTDEDGVQRWKTADKQINIYTEVLNVLKKQIGEENINKRNFVEKYLEVCRERGYMPRFAEFLNQDADGNYVYTEGYHKMLVDFKTFTQDEVGTYLPQGQIAPRFDVGYATQLLKDHSDQRLQEDSAFRAQVPGIVDEITEKVIGNAPRSKKSTRASIDAQIEQAREEGNQKDVDYLTAVKNGDMDTAQRMVRDKAKEKDVYTDKRGNPLALYHGTSSFGFTRFGTDYIFTTPDKGVAAGYANGMGYADPRNISDTYIKDDGTDATLIKNVKNVLGWPVRKVTQKDIDKVKEEFRERADEISDLIMDGWGYGEGFPEMPEDVQNGLDYMLIIAGEVSEDLDDLFTGDYPVSELEHSIELYNKYHETVREWFVENSKAIKAAGAEKLMRLVTGFDVSDFNIDVEHRLLRALHADDYLINSGDKFIEKEATRDYIEQVKNVGAYTLYGTPGDKPLEIDANGAFWTDIKAPVFGDGTYSTEMLVKKAKAAGYTSLVIRNVMDPAGNNYSPNRAADEYIFFNPEDVKSADAVTYDDAGNVIPLSERFDERKPDIRYSLRSNDPTSARAVLSSALESAAKTDAERRLLAKYQDMAIDLDVWQGAVASLRREIHELSFAEGARDTERIAAMRNEVDRLVKQITVADKTLLNLEASAPLKRLLENETARARKLERERGRAALIAEQTTQRERRERELDAMREQSNARIEELRRKKDEKYERDMQALREKKDAQIERIRQKRDEQLRAEIDKRIEMRTRERERRAATETRNKIKQRLNSIRKDLLEGRGNKAIPQGFVNGLIDMIDAIDPTGRKQDSQEAQRWRTGREMLADLRRVYEGLNPLDAKASADPDLKSLVENDPEFLEDIRYIAENFSDKPLRDLSLPDLETLYETIKRVWTRVRDAKRLIGATERASAEQSRTRVSGEMQRMAKTKIGKSKPQTFARNTFSNPMRMVREMTGYRADSEMNRLFTEIRKGWMKGEEFKMRAGKKMDEVRTTKADRKALRDAGKGTVEMTDSKGNTFNASLLQVMQYLLTYERTISNPNAEHLQYGSWFADVDSLRNGKRNEAVEKAHQVSAPDAQMLDRLYKLVNDNAWAVRFMENARYVLQQMSTEEINATSMILEGVPIARDNAYIPYRVMPEWVDRGTTNDKTQASVRNIGFTKRLIPSAKTPLLFEGLDLILQQHVDEVAKYVGLAVPIRNWNTVMYYGQRNDGIPVSKRVTDAWGTKSWTALKQAVADIQGRRQNNVPAWVSKIRSAWVFATLASNVSVTIKQAASYPTAGAYLSLGALRHGVNAYLAHPKSHQAIYDRMDALTAEGYMRRRGWTTQEFGDMPNGIQKVFNAVDRKLGQFSPFNWIQSVDVNTTTALFLACEYEIEHVKGIKKDDPRYRTALKNLYETVIENTQPMYDPVHQTEVSRSPFWNKFIVFQTQPLQNSGILRDATQQMRFMREIYGKDSAPYKTAKKQFGRALSSQIMTSIVFVAMTMAAKLLRHKPKDYEDDEGKLTAASIFSQLGVDAGMNLFSAIFPVVGNYATQIAQWVVNGRGDALLSDPTLDAVNEALDAFVNEFTNARETITGDAEYDLKKLKKFLVQMASFAGIPLGNAWNLAEGVALHVQDAVNGQFGSFEAGREQTTAQADKALYDAIIAGDQDKVDKAFKESKSSDAWHTKLRKILRDNDPRVAQMVQAYFQKDYKAQKKLRNAIKADGKFIFEDIRAAELSEQTYLGNQIEKAQEAYAAGDERTYEKTMAALEERGYDRAFLDEMFGDVEFASATGPWWENGEDETTPDAQVSQYRESDVAAIVLDGTASDRQMMFDDLVAYNMANGDSREDAVEATQITFRNAALALYKDKQYTISQVEQVYGKYGGYSGEDLYWAIDKIKGSYTWDSAGDVQQIKYDKYASVYPAVDSGSNLDSTFSRYLEHGTAAKDIASAITKHFKPLFKDLVAKHGAGSNEVKAMLKKLLDAYEKLGYDRNKKYKDIMTYKDSWLLGD